MNVAVPPPRLAASLPVRGRFAWAVETAVMLGTVLAADALMRPAFPLLDATPHLFWAPVLAISLTYGTVRGLACALAATLLGHWHGWPPLDGADLYATMLHEWKEPVLWFAAALLAGRHHERQAEAARTLTVRAAQAQEQRLAIATHARSLRDHIGTLEQTICLSPGGASAADPAREVSLADLAEAVEADDPQRLETALSRLSMQMTGSPVVAFWLADDDGYHRLWGAAELEALLPAVEDRLGEHNDAITLPHSVTASATRTQAQIAVPLRDKATGWLGGIALIGKPDARLKGRFALTVAGALGHVLSETIFAREEATPVALPIKPLSNRSLLDMAGHDDAAR